MSDPQLNTRASHLFPKSTGDIELFDEFFESGMEESISPFLKPKERKWGKNLFLKAAICAAFFLMIAYILSFFPTQQSLANVCILLSYFLAGVPPLISSIEDLFSFEIHIDVLMTLAAFLAILIGSAKEGALLLVLFSLSGAMEEAVSSKAKSSLQTLKKLAPEKAYVVQPDGSLQQRSVRDIKISTPIHIKAGELVPLDGIVTAGTSSLNLVHLTGESLPVTCVVGDSVPAGARNLDGAITIVVTQPSANSTLARIVQLITEAQEAKPKLQRWIDKFSSIYSKSIILLSFLLALLLPLFFSISYFGNEGSIYRALSFLIAASPCALVIAVPIAYLSAISICSKRGVLLKGGVVLDALAKCRTLAMDKTGTLTTGELSFLGIDIFGPTFEALSLAYALERSALHPIAQAIVQQAEKERVTLASIENFRATPGFGLEGTYEGGIVRIGKPDWILAQIDETLKQQIIIKLEAALKNGEVVTLLSYHHSAALFRFGDTIREGALPTLKALQENFQMRLVMLTGDHNASAHSVAQTLGITEYHAELKPEDKLTFISNENNLAMIGDGINDAPALARATVGISMGKVGSTTAIDASDIVLLQDNFELLEWLVKKSRQVVRIVKENLIIALGAIIVATTPALLGWIPLWLAVVFHEGGTLLVGLNALRLLKKR